MTRDPWFQLRRTTPARIALGRAGGSLPTTALLDFRLAHALARDAVHTPFDHASFASQLHPLAPGAIPLATRAAHRREFLLRPDLGRSLDPASRDLLARSASTQNPPDLAIIVSDGLSSLAALRQAPALLETLLPLAASAGWILAPVCVVRHARVAIQDEIGSILRARLALMLLGERPGLGAPDSLGAYFTRNPAPGLTDASRNCVSNIRPDGLPPAQAARKIFELLSRSLELGFSGVHLKDESPALPATPAPAGQHALP